MLLKTPLTSSPNLSKKTVKVFSWEKKKKNNGVKANKI